MKKFAIAASVTLTVAYGIVYFGIDKIMKTTGGPLRKSRKPQPNKD